MDKLEKEKMKEELFRIDINKLKEDDRRFLMNVRINEKLWANNILLNITTLQIATLSFIIASLSLAVTGLSYFVRNEELFFKLFIQIILFILILIIISYIGFHKAKRKIKLDIENADKYYKDIAKIHFKYAKKD